ncbi:hypothetical protein CN918_30080 [Priestia megaterium]|nr:hypothetical protein CN918_30080 [Priestia megaterium]
MFSTCTNSISFAVHCFIDIILPKLVCLLFFYSSYFFILLGKNFCFSLSSYLRYKYIDAIIFPKKVREVGFFIDELTNSMYSTFVLDKGGSLLKNQRDKQKQQTIHKLNGVIGLILPLLLIPILINQLKTNAPLIVFILVDGVIILSSILLLYSWRTKKWAVPAMYIGSIGTAVQFLCGMLDTHLYALLFITLIFGTIYLEWKVLVINVGITVITFHLYFRKFIPFEDPGKYPLLLVMYGAAFIGLLTLVLVSEGNRRKMVANQEALLRSQEELQQYLSHTQYSEQRLEVFNQSLHDNLFLTKAISTDIVENFSEITKGVESQTININTINESLKDIGTVIEQVADASEVVADASTQTDAIATEYSEEMANVTSEMEQVASSIQTTFTLVNELNEKNKSISDIVSTLNALASQTNLLSLNASIEAARAGEHGKGFAVVASEVGKLADDSRHASERIREILHEIREHTTVVAKEAKEGLNVVQNSRDTLLKTQSIFAEVSQHTQNITRHSGENKQVIHSLKDSAGLILNEMESIAATSEEVNASIEEILGSVENQNKNIDDILESFNDLHK